MVLPFLEQNRSFAEAGKKQTKLMFACNSLTAAAAVTCAGGFYFFFRFC